MRFVPLCLFLGLLAAPAFAEDRAAEVDPLVEAVRACKLSLREAMGPTYSDEGQPLGATFALDQEGRLLLRATVRVVANDDAWFETWTGFVHAGGWVPHKTKIEADAAFDDAARRWALLGQHTGKIRNALRFAVPGEEHAGPAEVVLSIDPVRVDGNVMLDMRVVTKGEARGLRYDVATKTYELRQAVPLPKPVSFEAPPLPSWADIDGTWFNVDELPTPESWRGSPVLVVITDPG